MAKTIRILIVDDERASRRRMAKLLSGIADIEIVGEAENGIVAVGLIESERPDVVLLDVRPEPEFRAGHIAGARSAPLEMLDELAGKLPKRRQIVAFSV